MKTLNKIAVIAITAISVAFSGMAMANTYGTSKGKPTVTKTSVVKSSHHKGKLIRHCTCQYKVKK